MDKQSILVIVESPSKIEKIKKYLNEIYKDKYEFIVKASYGHIRDLDTKKLSIDIDKNFKPTYILSQSKERVISELKHANKKCQEVWIASDDDREGEAIAFHISEILGIKPPKRKRITFSEITKQAIKSACENPKDINMDMFYAQQARRIIDRLIGYLISPVLWKQIQNSTKKKISLSAGRVQSVVMKLIIEREKEINKFESSSFYKTIGNFNNSTCNIDAELSDTFQDKKLVKEFLNHCLNSEFVVSDVIKKKSTRKPGLPFITSTLQQEASNKLRMSPKATMASAQKLYEGGYITYMRTDSYNLSVEATDNIKDYVMKNYGEKYLDVKSSKTKSKNSQEAHECIRPCNIKLLTLSEDNNMTNFEQRLYRLIWCRTVASQMSKAQVDLNTTKISVSECEKHHFITKSETIKFDGFLKVYKYKEDVNEDEEEEIKVDKLKLKKGDILKRNCIKSTQKYSKPPHGRFTEASLVKKLDEMGIGRPSTYSSMVSVVQDRNYATKRDKEGEEKEINIYELKDAEILKQKNKVKVNGEKQKLFPSQIGFIVNEFLTKHFSSIIDYKFTANLEDNLDKISLGEDKWEKIVKKIYNQFNPKVIEFNGTEDLEKDKLKRVLGIDPVSKNEVVTYIGKYGPLVQLKGANTRFAPLKDIDIKTVTLEQALELFKYPYTLLEYKGSPVEICKGKYGVYIKYSGQNYSLGEILEEQLNEDAIKTILEKTTEQPKSNIIKKINEKIIIKNGKFGPYISYKNKLNVKIYGNKKPEDLTYEDCVVMINKKKQKTSKN